MKVTRLVIFRNFTISGFFHPRYHISVTSKRLPDQIPDSFLFLLKWLVMLNKKLNKLKEPLFFFSLDRLLFWALPTLINLPNFLVPVNASNSEYDKWEKRERKQSGLCRLHNNQIIHSSTNLRHRIWWNTAIELYSAQFKQLALVWHKAKIIGNQIRISRIIGICVTK